MCSDSSLHSTACKTLFLQQEAAKLVIIFVWPDETIVFAAAKIATNLQTNDRKLIFSHTKSTLLLVIAMRLSEC